MLVVMGKFRRRRGGEVGVGGGGVFFIVYPLSYHRRRRRTPPSPPPTAHPHALYVVQVPVPLLGLSALEEEMLIQIVGPRYRENRQVLRLVSDRFPNRIDNKVNTNLPHPCLRKYSVVFSLSSKYWFFENAASFLQTKHRLIKLRNSLSAERMWVVVTSRKYYCTRFLYLYGM